VLYLQHCAPAPLALANQLPLPAIVQRGWSQHRRVSGAIEESNLCLYFYIYHFKESCYVYMLQSCTEQKDYICSRNSVNSCSNNFNRLYRMQSSRTTTVADGRIVDNR